MDVSLVNEQELTDIDPNPDNTDYWQARNIRRHMKNVKPAMMTVGGWFDAEDLFGALRLYSAAEKQSPGANNTLVMGPWIHGGWANNRAVKNDAVAHPIQVNPGSTPSRRTSQFADSFRPVINQASPSARAPASASTNTGMESAAR